MLPTVPTLTAAVGCSAVVAGRAVSGLRDACARFEIDTPLRLAAFLAQIGHESANLERLVEDMRYSAQRIRELGQSKSAGPRWRSMVARAEELGGHPQAFANAVYGGRMGNGPEASGDGWRYIARGYIGNTGKANYQAITDHLRSYGGPDFVAHPELLETPQWAAMASGVFWHDHDLNVLADGRQFAKITTRVNGGSTGAADRNARYTRALQVLRA